MFNQQHTIQQIRKMIENPLTVCQMNEMINQLKNVKDNTEKISIMKDKYYSFCPSSYTKEHHHFTHALYNAIMVLHEKPSVSKDEMIKMLERQNNNCKYSKFNIDDIKEIFNDF